LVSYSTLPVFPAFNISAALTQIPGAFPLIFYLAMARATSAHVGLSHLMSWYSSADAAKIMFGR